MKLEKSFDKEKGNSMFGSIGAVRVVFGVRRLKLLARIKSALFENDAVYLRSFDYSEQTYIHRWAPSNSNVSYFHHLAIDYTVYCLHSPIKHIDT